MRLAGGGNPRQAYYDRNPTTVVLAAVTTVSENQAETQRSIYTVPTAKKAFLALIQAHVIRTVLAATAVTTDEIIATWRLEPSGGASANMMQAALQSAGGAAGDRDSAVSAPSLVLRAGDQLNSLDQFVGTAAGAGRARVRLHGSYVEFDA